MSCTPAETLQETVAPKRDHRRMSKCSGGFTLDTDGTIAGRWWGRCDRVRLYVVECAAGRELRHEDDPTTCIAEWGGCNVCGVH